LFFNVLSSLIPIFIATFYKNESAFRNILPRRGRRKGGGIGGGDEP